MRKRERKLVFTFASTVDAMAMERRAGEQSAPGRLIPVPREITAGCGLAWAAPPEARNELEQLMAQAGLQPQAALELLL